MHAHLCCIFTSRPPTHCLLWHRYCALGLEYTSKGPWKRACSPTWCYRKAVGLVVGLGHCGGALEEDCRTFRSFLSPFHLRLRWTDLLGVCFCHGCYERSLFQELKAPKEWSQRPCFLSNWLPRAQWMRSSAEPRPERNIHTVSCSLTGLVEVLTMVLPTTMPDPLHFCSLPSSSTRFILQNTELNIAC